MPTRKLDGALRFSQRYRRLHNAAFARLPSGDDHAMQRLTRVGETLGLLATCPAPPQNDRRLDTQQYIEVATLAQSSGLVYGSKVRRKPDDYRVIWRQVSSDPERLELLDLVWPCS